MLPESAWSDLVIIGVTVLIGGVTFTGSVIAWAKLSEKMCSKPVLYGGQQVVNGLAVLLILVTILLVSLGRPLLGDGSMLNFLTPYSVFIVVECFKSPARV